MRTKPGFRFTDVCGVNILIAEGEENVDFDNIISMNESARLLWESVQDKAFTNDDLAKILVDNYQLDGKPLPYGKALKDTKEISRLWKEAGIISEA